MVLIRALHGPVRPAFYQHTPYTYSAQAPSADDALHSYQGPDFGLVA
jgi:hypothetical protein